MALYSLSHTHQRRYLFGVILFGHALWSTRLHPLCHCNLWGVNPAWSPLTPDSPDLDRRSVALLRITCQPVRFTHEKQKERLQVDNLMLLRVVASPCYVTCYLFDVRHHRLHDCVQEWRSGFNSIVFLVLRFFFFKVILGIDIGKGPFRNGLYGVQVFVGDELRYHTELFLKLFDVWAQENIVFNCNLKAQLRSK